MEKAEERTFQVPCGSMDVALFGRGDKPLVVIPGLSLRGVRGAGQLLAGTFKVFCNDFRVYVFDKVDPIPEGYTVSQMADDIALVMGELGLREASVLGVSMGGMISQYLALNNPQLVGKLVLGVTTSRSNATVREAVGTWIRKVEAEGYRGMLQDLLWRMYSEKYQKRYGKVFPLLLKLVKPIPQERFLAMAKACLTCDTYDRLGEIGCPVFVIGGEEDRVVGAEASREIAQKLGCEIYLYENLGHSAYEEAKDFYKRIFAFLEGTNGG